MLGRLVSLYAGQPYQGVRSGEKVLRDMKIFAASCCGRLSGIVVWLPSWEAGTCRSMLAGASDSHSPSPIADHLLRLQRRCASAEQLARAQAAALLTACTVLPDQLPADRRTSAGQPERLSRQSRASAGGSTADSLTGQAEMLHKRLIHLAPLAAASPPILSRVVTSLLQVQT